MRMFFRRPLDDVLACLRRLAGVKHPGLAMGGMFVVGLITWFIYVPIHELLHVAGCVVTGGDVTRLEIAPRYGAAVLAEIFPFVVPGGEYAGRLSGFDHKGSDLIYLATDFGPFLLTVLIGVPLLKAAGRGQRTLLFAVAFVVGLAPFYNIQGDYFEMGSIVATRAVTFAQGGGNPPAFEELRSDDIFKTLGDYFMNPARLGLQGAGDFALGALIILVGLILSIFFAFVTYWMGHQFSKLIARSPAA